MSGEQKIRAILYHVSLAVFLIGLPFILSFALGYKFNAHALKFTKTGLIAIKTQPPAASIYLNDKLLNDETPATIDELLPGNYRIKIELEDHYPWANDVRVDAGKVTRLDKIILFPLRSDIKQVNKNSIWALWIDNEKRVIYTVNPDDNGIYRSDFNGEHSEKIGDFMNISPAPLKYKVSSDRDRLLYFNRRQIAVVSLGSEKGRLAKDDSFVINYPSRIVEVFWHSDNYHIIVVSDKKIEALEAKPNAAAVNLINLNKAETQVYYDIDNDTLYFMDTQQAADGKNYDNLYKLELGSKFYLFQELIKLRSNEQE